MPAYPIETIAQVTSGTLISGSKHDTWVEHLLIDSRKIAFAEACLFIALKTSRNNGHAYIEPLYHAGVRCFLVDEEPVFSRYPAAHFVLVENSLIALQRLAAYHRTRFDGLSVTAITGSNGKTIVKEWITQLLAGKPNFCANPKSYNSQIGVPLSVWNLKNGDEQAIFEAGISQVGEMEILEKIIQPNIGIFTNIGTAHDENFHSKTEKIKEKLKLFAHAKAVIYNIDQQEIDQEIRRFPFSTPCQLFTWGYSHNADISIESKMRVGNQTHIKLLLPDQQTETITIPFTDDASIENALHVRAWYYYRYPSEKDMATKMSQLQPVAMRLELKEGINDCSIINDSYSMDLQSLQIALDFLRQQQQHSTRTVILSDILQSGKTEEILYGELAALLHRKGVQKMIGIGNALCRQAHLFNIPALFYPNTRSFLEQYPLSNFEQETVLIKGARIFQFEQIEKRLQRKAHETVLEVNLNALLRNINFFRSQIHKNVKIAAMVKAFTYGIGSFEIGNLLQYHNIDYLIVAFADEGVELRKHGITLPILVLNPEESSFDLIIKHELEPEIYSFRTLRLLQKALDRQKNKTLSIHLKLDTGMHRLGFLPEEIPLLINHIGGDSALKIASVFSHLAAADDPQAMHFTQQQITQFSLMSDQIKNAFPYPILRHLCNSAAISTHHEAHFDMVRLGIGMHGIAARPEDQKYLEVVSTLKTVISQIHHIPAGDTVGYNQKWKAENNARIATLPIGYADGLDRRWGNENGYVMIQNQKAPLIGNICMDMCMVDVTKIDCWEGEEVVVFGENLPIQTMAKSIETIPYEILTGLSQRIKRIYCYE